MLPTVESLNEQNCTSLAHRLFAEEWDFTYSSAKKLLGGEGDAGIPFEIFRDNPFLIREKFVEMESAKRLPSFWIATIDLIDIDQVGDHISQPGDSDATLLCLQNRYTINFISNSKSGHGDIWRVLKDFSTIYEATLLPRHGIEFAASRLISPHIRTVDQDIAWFIDGGDYKTVKMLLNHRVKEISESAFNEVRGIITELKDDVFKSLIY